VTSRGARRCRGTSCTWPRGAPHGLVEAEVHVGIDVLPAHRAGRAGAGAGVAGGPAEEPAEQVAEIARTTRAEDVRHVERRAAGAAGATALEATAAERAATEQRPRLVVLLALRVVGEDVVGLGDLLEPSFGLRIARVLVRVQLAGELPVGLLDLSRGRVLGDAQRQVVVLLDVVLGAHWASPP
jgi:hypothetical protein